MASEVVCRREMVIRTAAVNFHNRLWGVKGECLSRVLEVVISIPGRVVLKTFKVVEMAVLPWCSDLLGYITNDSLV